MLICHLYVFINELFDWDFAFSFKLFFIAELKGFLCFQIGDTSSANISPILLLSVLNNI